MVGQLAEKAVAHLAAVMHVKAGGGEAVDREELRRQKT
jgi:hypothetical protein